MNNFSARFLYAIAGILILLSSTAVAAPQNDVMLVLDNSGSMRKNDPTFLARGAVESFINKLDTNSRAGVLIFDHSVTQAVPLTTADANGKSTLIKSLENINYRGQLTDSPAAVERAIYELKTNKREGADQFIVFMTDGIVDTGNPAADVEKTKWLREELAVDAADNGIKVFAIAFTEHADFFLIQSLAKKTHGEYFRALSPADLAGVFDTVLAKLSQPPAPPPEPVALPPAKTPEATVITPLPDDTVTSQPLPAPEDPADLLASLSADERQALEEISEQTGIPIEQLAFELVGPDPTDTAEQPEPGGVIITYPEDEITEAEQRMGYAILAASAAFLLLLVGFIVWFIMRRRKSSPAAAATATAAPVPADTPAIPEAFINDVHGYTDEPVIRLGEKPMMVGRVAGTDTQHLDYLVVNKGTVGRRHAVIKYKDFSFWLVDQGSVNGTFVNAERISGERQLKHGDKIRFHKYDFDFSQPDMDDGSHTILADPNAADATIVASAATLAATSAMDLAASIDEQIDFVEEDTVVRDEAPSDADDMFGSDDDAAPGESPAAAFADAPAYADSEVFDVTGDTEMPAGDPGDETIDEDLATVSVTSPGEVSESPQVQDDLEATANNPIGEDEEDLGVEINLDVVGDGMPEDYDEDEEDLGVEINLDAVGEAGQDEDFDAEASAFFEDITVGPTPDDITVGPTPDDNDDMFDIAGGADTNDDSALDAKLDQASAILDSTATDLEATTGGGLREPDDPNDMTMEQFIETDSFEAPATIPPVDPRVIAGEEELDDVTLDAFMSTALFAAKVEVTNEDMTVLPEQVPDNPNNEDDMFSSDTVVMPGSPAKDKKPDDDDESEDPTVVK